MATVAKNLVSVMGIPPASAAGKSEYKSQTYYLGCRKAFDKQPGKYLSKGFHAQHHQPPHAHQKSFLKDELFHLYPCRHDSSGESPLNCIYFL